MLRYLIPSPPRLLVIATVMLVALLAYPVRSEISRSGIVVSLAVADLALLLVIRKRRKLLLVVSLPQLLILIFLVLPGRPHDPTTLREAYVSALKRFEGTRYVWGGENHLGVDCSGLIRAALIEANVIESLRTLNPALLRSALYLWWHDASADRITSGCQGLTTIHSTKTQKLTTAHVGLQPGDFAGDGSHILAYLGNGEWIEADPFVLKVIRLKPGGSSSWWIVSVTTGHWKTLEPVK